MPAADVRVLDVALTVLGTVAPDELAHFDLVVSAYRAAPRAARSAGRGGNEPTASSPLLASEAMGTLALAVGAELAADMLAGRGAGTRRRWWPRRSAGVDAPAVGLDEVDIPDLRARARELSLRRGASEQDAISVAAAFAAAWPRSSKA